MDEKDPNEEELNPQGQDDINDADDSFGLPDLEYKPLDDDSEESDSGETDSDSESNEGAENTTTEEEVESEESEEELNESFSEDSIEEETEFAEEKETPAYRYQVEEKSSIAPKIIGGIIGVLVVAVAIWYFGFYGPQQKVLADQQKAKQEEVAKKARVEAAALKAKKDEEAAAAAAAARLMAEEEAKAIAGVQILEERTNRYYVVLESFIDGDFAMDFGNKIAKEGTPSFLIPPYSKKKMQRVAIGGYESVDEAQTALNNLSDEFGKGKWILKY